MKLLMIATAVSSLVAAVSQEARACAVCAAADTTLPSNGSETPFGGRVRATLDGRAVALRSRTSTAYVREARLDPGFAIAPTSTVLLSTVVPGVFRYVDGEARTTPAGAEGPPTERVPRAETLSLGDVELRASHLAWQSGPASIVRRLGVTLGTKLPTAPVSVDADGHALQPDMQAGCGSIMPFAGMSYAWTASWWSLSTTALLMMPLSVRDGPHPGDSLRLIGAFQLQPRRDVGVRLTFSSRLDSTGDIDGAADVRSGGFIAYVAPEIIVSPFRDAVVSVGVSVPAVQALRGIGVASPVAMVGIGLDL